MSLHFGHESNLIPLMTSLNLTSSDCLNQRWKNQTITSLNCMQAPKFGANLIFELTEDDSFNHFISIKYNGEYAYICDSKNIKCRY